MHSHPSLSTVFSRSLLARDDDDAPSNFTCARPETNDHGEPLSIGITFKTLMICITAVCVCLTTISAVTLASKHLRRYTVPKEQRQIVRIVSMPMFFAIVSLLSVLFYQQSIYLKPLMAAYEAFCVAGLFFLFLEYVCPKEEKRAAYFSAVENKDKKGNVIPGGSLLWFNRTWVCVLQFPLMKALLTIAEIGTQAGNVYCANSLSPDYAHLWLLLIDIFILGPALTALFKFYGRLKPVFPRKHHALAKLVAFKGIVIFQFFLDVIFGILNGKTFKPSAKFTYNDLYYGLPMMLTAFQALCFSLAFHWAFRSRMYHEDEEVGEQRLSVSQAVRDAANLIDIMKAIYVAFVKKSYNGVKDPQASKNGIRGWFSGPSRSRTLELDGTVRVYGPVRDQRENTPSPVPGAHRGYREGDERSRRSSSEEGRVRVEPRTMV